MPWIVLLVLSSSLTFASEKVATSRLLRCLGAQEQRFHKLKTQGAFYELNQRLIGELIQAHGVDANASLLKQVCTKNPKSALAMLEAMLLDQKDWFVIKATDNKMQDSINRELVKELNQTAPEILLNFIASLQVQAPSADCLEKHIPGIGKLHHEVKWLQEEVDLTKITLKRSRLTKIFAGIARSEEFFQLCAAEEKAKKTSKAAGKPSDQ